MTRIAVVIALLLAAAFVPIPRGGRPPGDAGPGVTVGSKKFTESVVLGEMIRLLAEQSGTPAEHYRELGGTKLVLQALVNGEIDIYPEYTGTIAEEILTGQSVDTPEAMRAALAELGVGISEPLGFNNTYALGMLRSRAEEIGVETISDLADHPDLRLGFGHEFIDRADGWQAVQWQYALPQQSVAGLDHDLAYRQLQQGLIDVMDAYATDAKIAMYDLTLLEDDRRHFPRYDAVLLYRSDLAERFPAALDAARRLEGAIDERQMVGVNAAVVVGNQPGAVAAAEYLAERFGLSVTGETETAVSRVTQRTLEHLDLVRKSLIPAILLAAPLGVIAAKKPKLGQFILGAVGVIQTIPSLALLVVLMPVMAGLSLPSVGPGSATAIVALVLYSLLPIVRNTHAGLTGIAREHREAAAALGLPAWYRLVEIELPLASRGVLAGVKTAAVINVGFAT
ncbi:MAG: glycine betaine ABC transporter substrate-binding protein, partial [Planctomycetota bacterium]